jgi:hypothetical protein
MFAINSDIKHINTRLQDLFNTSLKKRHEHDYITLTSRSTTIPTTTTLSNITYQDVSETFRQPFTKQDIIIFGSIFCAIISLITLLIICMLCRKSISLSQCRGKRQLTTNYLFSNQQHKNANISLNPINDDSDCNAQDYKPKLRLKPLHLVIKHQDYLNKKEKERKISYRLQESEARQSESSQRFDTYQQENDPHERINAGTTLRENNFQDDNNERKVRVRFNEVVKVINNKFKIENEIDRINLNKILAESSCENKGKNIELESSVDKDYDDLTVYDIVKIFKTLDGVYRSDVKYSYI